MIIHNPILTGSFTVNGTDVASITSSAASITAINAYTASQNILNGTYATTGSNTFKNPQTINSNLIVTGSITAATLVVQTITSSVIYSSGSNVFGNNIANTQVMTGSVLITGSVGIGTSNPSYSLDVTGTGRFTTALTIGSTESTWNLASSNRLQLNNSVLAGYSTTGTFLGMNLNYNGAWKYISNGYASIYSQDTGEHVFYTSTSGSATATATLNEKMKITNAGNVGIGVTPSYVLDVVNSSSPSLRVRNGALGGTATLLLETANNFSGTCQTYVKCIGAVGSGVSELAFGTAGASGDATATERMRITSGGAVVIGGTTAVLTSGNRANLTLSGTASSLLGFSNGTSYTGYIYNDYGANVFQWVSTGNTIQVVNSSNGVQLTSGATSWSSLSDERLKNITGNIENAVDSLMTLRAIKHTWKSDGNNKENLGLIAQDVEKVFPQVIDKNKLPSKLDDENKNETEYLTVRYTELIPVLVKAIQELKTQNDDLQAQITELKNK